MTMSRKAPQGSSSKSTNKSSRATWWETLEDECPITLEPLSSLPYPPFELGANTNASLFDGVALASYIVSRAIFENPLTRQPLLYSDCKRLDDYVKMYHPQDVRMACCCEAFMLHQSVKVERDHNENDESRSRVLRSEAAAALCRLFVYGRQNMPPDNVTWTTTPNEQQPSSFNLYAGATCPTTVNDVMDGLRIIDDDEERVTQAQQSELRHVQQSFPPLVHGTTSCIPNVGVNQHLLQTVQLTATQTRQEEYRKQILHQQAQRRLIQQARARQEERSRERRAAKCVHQQEMELQRLEREELERARAEIEKWRKEHWDRLLQQTEAIKQEANENIQDSCKHPAAVQDAETTMKQVVANEQAKLEELVRRQEEQAAKKRAKRQRAKQRKKEQKEREQKEIEKRQEEQVYFEKKAASTNKCECCGEGYLGCGFEKFGHSFCSTKCARAGVSTTLNSS
jgi:hypothetical protein